MGSVVPHISDERFENDSNLFIQILDTVFFNCVRGKRFYEGDFQRFPVRLILEKSSLSRHVDLMRIIFLL